MESQQSSNLNNDKDWVLFSIYGPLEKIEHALRGKNNSSYLVEVVDLKNHSSGLLLDVFENYEGDPNYRDVPQTPTDLKNERGAMLTATGWDVTCMRGYLKGKPQDTHVVHFRSLRNNVNRVLAIITQPTVTQAAVNPAFISAVHSASIKSQANNRRYRPSVASFSIPDLSVPLNSKLSVSDRPDTSSTEAAGSVIVEEFRKKHISRPDSKKLMRFMTTKSNMVEKIANIPND